MITIKMLMLQTDTHYENLLNWNIYEFNKLTIKSLNFIIKYIVWFALLAWPFSVFAIYAWRFQPHLLHITLQLAFLVLLILLIMLHINNKENFIIIITIINYFNSFRIANYET